jgi:hypothetical protein
MANSDRPRSEDLVSLRDRGEDDGLVEVLDPARSAARVVTEEVLSILQAVEARTSEIHAGACREAEAIRRAADRAGADAVGRFAAITRELDALEADLAERAARRGDDH